MPAMRAPLSGDEGVPARVAAQQQCSRSAPLSCLAKNLRPRLYALAEFDRVRSPAAWEFARERVASAQPRRPDCMETFSMNDDDVDDPARKYFQQTIESVSHAAQRSPNRPRPSARLKTFPFASRALCRRAAVGRADGNVSIQHRGNPVRQETYRA